MSNDDSAWWPLHWDPTYYTKAEFTIGHHAFTVYDDGERFNTSDSGGRYALYHLNANPGEVTRYFHDLLELRCWLLTFGSNHP